MEKTIGKTTAVAINVIGKSAVNPNLRHTYVDPTAKAVTMNVFKLNMMSICPNRFIFAFLCIPRP